MYSVHCFSNVFLLYQVHINELRHFDIYFVNASTIYDYNEVSHNENADYHWQYTVKFIVFVDVTLHN